MCKMSFFKTTKISDKITKITGIAQELMYLVEGDEKAALIDTGVGVGNLRELVESLTEKPVIVLLTHGHVDHAMGAPAFNEVYIHACDEKVYEEHRDMNVRKGFVEMSVGEQFSLIEEADYIPSPKLDFKPLLPGDVFPLGGVTLEIYKANGHTPGSVAILFKEDRILLLGDACNSFTFLFDEISICVEEYKMVLEKLYKETEGKYDRTFFSHGQGEGEKEMISGVIKVCEDILHRKTDDVPFDFMGNTEYIAKEIDSNMNRVDKGFGNIIYDKNKIYSSISIEGKVNYEDS